MVYVMSRLVITPLSLPPNTIQCFLANFHILSPFFSLRKNYQVYFLVFWGFGHIDAAGSSIVRRVIEDGLIIRLYPVDSYFQIVWIVWDERVHTSDRSDPYLRILIVLDRSLICRICGI